VPADDTRLAVHGQAGTRPRHARRRPRNNQTLAIAVSALAIVVIGGLLMLRLGPGSRQRPAEAGGAAPRMSRATTPPVRHHDEHASAAAFTATGGPFCGQSSAVVTSAYHSPDGDGWHRTAEPGLRGGLCGRYFLYSKLAEVPGDPYQWQDDYDWTFNTGLAAPSCRLSFYVPVSAHSNSAVYYWITAGSQNIDDQIASFTVDQASHRGQWLTRGPFVFPGGTVFIELTDRGEGSPGADAVAAPVRVRC